MSHPDPASTTYKEHLLYQQLKSFDEPEADTFRRLGRSGLRREVEKVSTVLPSHSDTERHEMAHTWRVCNDNVWGSLVNEDNHIQHTDYDEHDVYSTLYSLLDEINKMNKKNE